LESDFNDIQGGTTAEGIHLGAMAGTVDHVQRCYTGLEASRGVLWLNPKLPEELQQLELRICYRGHCLETEITHERLVVRSIPSVAEAVKIGFDEDVHELRAGETRTFSLNRGD
jgi:trehalose/maltose hydrolase-like predicted phosphorylase